MPRPDKVQAVADIHERFERARAVFLAEYAGLSVAQQQTLRRGLKEQGAEFKIVKMTLARRAVAELKITGLDELLLGPTGIAFADGDPVGAAKSLQDFAKDHEVFTIKGGLLGAEFLTPERVSDLASIEPRDVLLAKLAGLFAAPMSNVASILAGLQREMAGLIQAVLDQRIEDEPEPEVAAPEAASPGADEAEDTAAAPQDEDVEGHAGSPDEESADVTDPAAPEVASSGADEAEDPAASAAPQDKDVEGHAGSPDEESGHVEDAPDVADAASPGPDEAEGPAASAAPQDKDVEGHAGSPDEESGHVEQAANVTHDAPDETEVAADSAAPENDEAQDDAEAPAEEAGHIKE